MWRGSEELQSDQHLSSRAVREVARVTQERQVERERGTAV